MLQGNQAKYCGKEISVTYNGNTVNNLILWDGCAACNDNVRLGHRTISVATRLTQYVACRAVLTSPQLSSRKSLAKRIVAQASWAV